MRILALLEFLLVLSAAIFSSKDPVFFSLYIPAILIEIFRDSRCDEMFRYYRSRSTAETFYSVMVMFSTLGIVGIEDVGGTLNTFLAGSLALKNSLAVFHTMDRKKALKTVGFSISAVLAVFVLLSHGVSIAVFVESAVPISVFLTTLLALRFRILGSILFFLHAVVLAGLVLKRARGIGGVAVFLLLILPVCLLGFRSLRKE